MASFGVGASALVAAAAAAAAAFAASIAARLLALLLTFLLTRALLRTLPPVVSTLARLAAITSARLLAHRRALLARVLLFLGATIAAAALTRAAPSRRTLPPLITLLVIAALLTLLAFGALLTLATAASCSLLTVLTLRVTRAPTATPRVLLRRRPLCIPTPTASVIVRTAVITAVGTAVVTAIVTPTSVIRAAAPIIRRATPVIEPAPVIRNTPVITPAPIIRPTAPIIRPATNRPPTLVAREGFDVEWHEGLVALVADALKVALPLPMVT